jgi:UDP-N-acetylmuramyl pentapeptide synthase
MRQPAGADHKVEDDMKLREIAHSRTGDKGNTSNISVITFEKSDYNFLCEHVTSERVKTHFAEIVHGQVTRYELPLIGALNFVLADALGGGVTRSLALDAHGKGLSSALLDLDLPDRPE